MRARLPIILASLVALAAATTAAAGPLAPFAAGAASTHGPFASGECKICHERADPRNPGAVTRPLNDMCFDCHDDFRGPLLRTSHPSPGAKCTSCHNPHNSMKKRLLL